MNKSSRYDLSNPSTLNNGSNIALFYCSCNTVGCGLAEMIFATDEIVGLCKKIRHQKIVNIFGVSRRYL